MISSSTLKHNFGEKCLLCSRVLLRVYNEFFAQKNIFPKDIPDREKMLQEQNSLTRIGDSFKKIIIVKDAIKSHYNEDGVLILNLFDFLLEENGLEN